MMSQDTTAPINLSVTFLCIYIGTPPFITLFKYNKQDVTKIPLYNYFVKNVLYIPIYIIINLQYMYLIS